MGFWCCVVAPKTVLLFIPLAIYIWNRFLQSIWSNFWNKNREEEIENHVIEDTNFFIFIGETLRIFLKKMSEFHSHYRPPSDDLM